MNNLKNKILWIYHSFFNQKLIKSSKIFWNDNYKKYNGSRVFIVCNGPSLTMEDLDAIKDEYSIASNKIYLAFSETQWRPNFLTVSDRILWNKIKNTIYKYYYPIILTSNLINHNKNKSILIKNIGSFKNNNNGFSKDMNKGIFGGRTVTYNNIQLAVHLGFKEIYLIGCDHYYDEKIPSSSTIVEHNEGVNNHFHKDYRHKGEKVNYAPVDIMETAYQNAKNNLEQLNIKIYNASRKTHLDIFEKINFDDLFVQ